MTYTLSTPLSEAIDAAEKAGAWKKPTIDLLRALDRPGMTIGDLAGHPTGAEWAYIFARDVIKGRFEAGEAVIAKDARCALRYSMIPGVPSDWRANA